MLDANMSNDLERKREHLLNLLIEKRYIYYVHRKPGKFSPKSIMFFPKRAPKFKKFVDELEKIANGEKCDGVHIMELFGRKITQKEAKEILHLLKSTNLITK